MFSTYETHLQYDKQMGLNSTRSDIMSAVTGNGRQPILDQFKTTPNITDAEITFLDDFLGRKQTFMASPMSYFSDVVNTLYAHQYETKFGLITKMLNTSLKGVDESGFCTYMDDLLAAFRQFTKFAEQKCLFGPLATALLAQSNNLEEANRREENAYIKRNPVHNTKKKFPGNYTRMMFTTYLMRALHQSLLFTNSIKNEQLDESKKHTDAAGGAERYCQQQGKWPLHVVLESAREGARQIVDHLLQLIEQNHALKKEKMQDSKQVSVGQDPMKEEDAKSIQESIQVLVEQHLSDGIDANTMQNFLWEQYNQRQVHAKLHHTMQDVNASFIGGVSASVNNDLGPTITPGFTMIVAAAGSATAGTTATTKKVEPN